MRKVLDGIGFTAFIIGFAGVAGAVERGTNVAVPLIVLMVGALMMEASSLWETYEINKKNHNHNANHMRMDARPHYLR